MIKETVELFYMFTLHGSGFYKFHMLQESVYCQVAKQQQVND